MSSKRKSLKTSKVLKITNGFPCKWYFECKLINSQKKDPSCICKRYTQNEAVELINIQS